MALCVGDAETWQRTGGGVSGLRRCAFVKFEEVAGFLWDLPRPELILSPLVTRRFDCIDLAELLHRHRFRGRYRAMSDGLPDPDLVCAEIRGEYEGLDFGIVRMPLAAFARPS